jgi:preprotein translocase subunit SecE
MSRAIRRQQQTATKESAPPRRGLGLSRKPQPTRGARPPSTPRRRFRIGVPHWLADIVSELKKVTWPSREETSYLTMVVIIVSLVVGAVLGIIDIFFSELIDRLLLS